MSKIRNLFKKLTKSKQKPQDSEEEFFDDIEIEELEDDSSELSEQTVILNTNDLNDELIPHETNTESEIPPDSELVFPKVPVDTPQGTDTAVVLTEDSIEGFESTGDLELSDLSLDSLDDNTNDDIVVDEVETSPPEVFDESDELEEFDETEILEAPPEELTNVSYKLDKESLEDESEVEDEFSEIESEVEDEFSENAQNGNFTQTDTIDLNASKVSIKDKLDHLKTRAYDRFRNLNKKDLNSAFKSSSNPTKKFDINKIKAKTLSINWGNIPNVFFNKANRNQYHKVFQTSAILIAVFTVASLIGVYLNSSKDYKSLTKRANINFDDSNKFTKTELGEIKSANVFRTDKIKAVEDVSKPKVITDKVCKTATRKSRSGIKVISTIVLQDSVKSIASVQMRSSSELQSIREGQTLQGKVKVDKIDRLKLIVKNLTTGNCEFIENEKASKAKRNRNALKIHSPTKSKQIAKKRKKIKGIENDGNNFKIERSFLKEKLSDINSILTQARGIPINNPDGTISFKIVDIEPSGLFAYLGMENGDVISEINGEPIKELNEVMNLFSRVGNLSALNLTIKRNGEAQTQNYNIK